MGKIIRILCIMLFYIISGSVKLQAQTLPVGTQVLEDAYRRAQLLGQIDSSVSFTARPFFPTNNLTFRDDFDPVKEPGKNSRTKFDGILRFGRDKSVLKLLPITWQQQYNSDHPEGINDGAMIPARGYQTLFSGGIYAQYGSLSIQLRPEMVYAENRAFKGFPHEYSDLIWSKYYRYLNNIDLPERFGDNSYKKIFWGQSSIRLAIGPISMGLSNENLWWGPGMRNSLLMTNNASGFKHFTLNTVRPIRSPIGSFEGQIIAGRLDGSGFTPPESDRLYLGKPIYKPKKDGWRYINGLVLTYQPKWVPGFFLGVTRCFTMYRNDMQNKIGDYLPIFIPVEKSSTGGAAEDAINRDQLASVFLRWLWTEEQGEFYFEYGREDHAWNIRDLIQEPAHSGGYIIGLRKLITLSSLKKEYLQVNMEITQLEANETTINRGGGSWYLHSGVKHGYTHLGQVLGAGIGPGSNLQTINISWIKSLKLVGIQFERYVHNNDFLLYAINDERRNWVDLSAAIVGEWNYKNLLFNAKVEAVRCINYEWQYNPKLSTPQQYWNQTKDVFNFHGEVGITYRFNYYKSSKCLQ